MVVAVLLPDQRILGFNPLEETILSLASQFPETTWIVFSAKNKKQDESFPGNVLQENLPKNWKNGLIKALWYKTALPKLIRKHGITHYWAKEAFLLKHPSVAISVLGDEYLLKGNWLTLKRKLINTTASILFSEDSFPIHVKEKFGAVGKHVMVQQRIPVLMESDSASSLEFPYFLCNVKDADKAEVLSLLKAFSFFKKRMNSATKLLMLTDGKEITELVDNYQNYKFRNDVHFHKETKINDLWKLIQDCVAFIDLSNSSLPFFSIHLVANQGRAIIAKEEELKRKIFSDSLAYFNSEETLAAQMINMYKDENLRSFYVESVQNLYHQREINFENKSLTQFLQVKEL